MTDHAVVGTTKSRALRVVWMLEELGLPFEHHPVAPHSEEIKRLNPSGKLPVLVEGDNVLTDSTAILTYLADKHGAFTYPAGTIDRARQDSLTNFLLDEFDACLWAAARHSFVLPEDRRVPEVKDTLKWEFERSQKRLVDRMNGGPFLMGDKMTISDIIAGHCGSWAMSARFPISEPVFQDYVDRMLARPAYVRAAAR